MGAPPARREPLTNGMWGLALLLATEGAFFGTVIGTYFFLRVQSEAWPPPGIEAPSVAVPVLLTVVLIVTSVGTIAASRAAGAGRMRRALRLLGVATLVQAGYLAAQIELFVADLEKFGFEDTAYGSIYYTMLAIDHAHVAFGLAVNLWVLAAKRAGAVRVAAWYWVFVAAVSVAVVATQVSPS